MIISIMSAILCGQDKPMPFWIPLELRDGGSYTRDSHLERPGSLTGTVFTRASDSCRIVISLSDYETSSPVPEKDLRFGQASVEITRNLTPMDQLPLGVKTQITYQPSFVTVIAMTLNESVRVEMHTPRTFVAKGVEFPNAEFAGEEEFLVRIARESLSRFAAERRAEASDSLIVSGNSVPSISARKSRVRYVQAPAYLAAQKVSYSYNKSKASMTFSIGSDRYVFLLGTPKYMLNGVWRTAKDIPLLHEEMIWLPLDAFSS